MNILPSGGEAHGHQSEGQDGPRHRTVNFEDFEGKEYTTRFRKQVEIPSSGLWFFIAYTPEGEEFTTIKLRISKTL